MFPLGTASLGSRLNPSLSCPISLLQLPCCPTRYNSACFPVHPSAYCIPTNSSSLNRLAGSPITRTRHAYTRTPSSTWPASAKPWRPPPWQCCFGNAANWIWTSLSGDAFQNSSARVPTLKLALLFDQPSPHACFWHIVRDYPPTRPVIQNLCHRG